MPGWTITAQTTGSAIAPSGLVPRRVSSGYTWTLVLTPADGVGNNLTLGGSITSRQTPRRRSPDF